MRTKTSSGGAPACPSSAAERSVGVKLRRASSACQRENAMWLGCSSRPRSNSTPCFSGSRGAWIDSISRSGSMMRRNSACNSVEGGGVTTGGSAVVGKSSLTNYTKCQSLQ
jgi:hypothetical protein